MHLSQAHTNKESEVGNHAGHAYPTFQRGSTNVRVHHVLYRSCPSISAPHTLRSAIRSSAYILVVMYPLWLQRNKHAAEVARLVESARQQEVSEDTADTNRIREIGLPVLVSCVPRKLSAFSLSLSLLYLARTKYTEEPGGGSRITRIARF